MTRSKKLILWSFLISLLLHLLLLLKFSFVFFSPKEYHEKSPQYYVPSYVQTGKITPHAWQQKSISKSEVKAEQPSKQKLVETSDDSQKLTIKKQSILAKSFAMLRQEQFQNFNSEEVSDPMYLVGDQNVVADPLIKLIGRALSANFAYPKMAGEFGIAGRVIIRMVLHPEGYFSNIEILESSQNQDLDSAALYAVNKAPLIPLANRFISEPKPFVIGFIFKMYP